MNLTPGMTELLCRLRRDEIKSNPYKFFLEVKKTVGKNSISPTPKTFVGYDNWMYPVQADVRVTCLGTFIEQMTYITTDNDQRYRITVIGTESVSGEWAKE